MSPTGHVAYSPSGQPVDAFLDTCLDLALQQDQQEQQQGEEQQLSDQEGLDLQQQQQRQASLLSDEQQQQQQLAGIPEEQQELGGSPTHLEELASEGLQGQSLADVCGQPDCWGLLGLDLMTGEAALHEGGACKLHVAPGEELAIQPLRTIYCVCVWGGGISLD